MLLLQPIDRVQLGGKCYAIACSMRVLYRIEQQLGFGLHMATRGSAALVGRVLVWAMIAEHNADVSLHKVGTAAAREFTVAVDSCAQLLKLASPVPDPADKQQLGAELEPRTDWVEMWSIGRHDLRLAEEEFWSMAPVLFHALLVRWDEARCHAEYCANIGAAMTANVNRAEGAEPADPGMLTRGKIGQEAQRRYLRPAADLKQKLSMLSSALPVKVIHGGAAAS